ncbi:MAG: DUF4293 family protein [Bacteroidetes bacterium]|nr:DUF4293 family protein [Bacteroidota bacterium]MBP6314727.1 DUF4293 family protein [Chitinophagaceae bacterium]
MIQRKQTLWFLASSIIAALAFVLPFGFKNTTSLNSYHINIRDFDAQTEIILILLFGAIVVVNLCAIFLFKKRPLQITASFVGIVLGVVAFAYEIYFSTKEGNTITFGIANSVLYIGLLLPLLSVALTFLAMRGVQQDIKLLKETDRLR